MNAQILAVVVGTLIPILNGLLTHYEASKARVYLQLVLNAAAGFGAEWLHALTAGTEYDVRSAATAALLALVTSIAVQAGVWAPLGVSEAAKRAGVGSGS
jgi:hypothetical protein